VVNVDGITRTVRTGDLLRVDGDRGVVERLVTPAAAALNAAAVDPGPRP